MSLDPRYPHQLAHRDWTVLVCHPDGSVPGDDGCGLFDRDCRILSRYRLTLNGEVPEWVSGGPGEAEEWRASVRLPTPGGGPDGPGLPQDALELRIARRVGRGMVERLELHNHSMLPRPVRLALEIEADFADVLEVAQDRYQQRGRSEREWSGDRLLTIRYRAEHEGRRIERGLRVRVVEADTLPVDELVFDLSLEPRQAWAATLHYESLADRAWRTPVIGAAADPWAADRDRASWRARRPQLASTNGSLEAVWDAAAEDLYALRNRELEETADAWVVNAGTPIFTGLFGRDVLTAGWQAALLGPEWMRGALEAVGLRPATADDAWRDAEPGKLIHELRRGPFAELGITAQDAYYGTQTTAAMYPLVLSELWHATGDIELLRRHRAVAEGGLEWASRHGDLDGDGFLEYRKRSPVGIKNQAWKDSDEAIRDVDGSQVANPIATVEEQAFHFLALTRMAEICVGLEDDDAAERHLDRARRLRERWHEAYWMEDEGFYAMALDPQKRQVRSIGSNAGHALATGIVPGDVAERVCRRLMADDLFSGWGIRTLSTAHPAYNPWAYHLGTVWPVENATFALGFKRYGFDALVERLVVALLDAARGLPGMHLPEAIGGQSREELPIPTVYPMANCPQAWSASATLQLVQLLLGIYPFAPARMLALVRPRLPAGVEELTLANLAVGDARVTLRFRRNPDGSASHTVVDQEGTLFVLDAPPPSAETTEGPMESVARFALEHAPGRLARAGRLALGLID